ncbi:serine-rich adhesin for platelets-like [Pecten maximus]|uniref:serine-rich adhesin for platelets-like n=1 Tax=Pecten maximus TaxID=6579 RepID=UPI00145864C7|nr:serine-rich adhesin for platelets-like [Pecten maximus]
MASVLILISCLTVFVNCQDVTKTTRTQIFVDPSGEPNNPLADAFHVATNTAESTLVQNPGDLNEITRTLQGFGPNLPEALKQMLRGSSVDAAVSEANRNSDNLLMGTGNKVQKAFQVAQNNAALQQAQADQRQKMVAASRLEQEVIKQLLKEQALQQQQQQQQQLQQRLQQQLQQQQQQQLQQQQTSIIGSDNIPQPGQQLISDSLLTSSSFSQIGSSDNNPFSSSGSRSGGSTGSSSSTSTRTSTSTSSTSQTSSVSEKKSESSKKKALAEKLRKLKAKIEAKKKAKIEAKKKAKAAAKAKAKAEADLAAQRQDEELSSRNEFNSAAISTTGGITSQTVLAQAGEHAQAEAALNLQGLNPIQLPMGAASQAIMSGVNTVVSPGRPFGTPFNSQNQFPTPSSTIGTLDINASPLVPAQPNLMQQGPIRRASLPFASSPLRQRGGFVATVTGDGTVVPDNINYGIGQFQMPRSLVQFPRSSQISYTQSLASPILSSPSITYNSVASPVISTSYGTPYMVNPSITAAYSMMPMYRSSVFTGVPYSSSVVMNAPYRSSVSSFNTGQNIYVTPV